MIIKARIVEDVQLVGIPFKHLEHRLKALKPWQFCEVVPPQKIDKSFYGLCKQKAVVDTIRELAWHLCANMLQYQVRACSGKAKILQRDILIPHSVVIGIESVGNPHMLYRNVTLQHDHFLVKDFFWVAHCQLFFGKHQFILIRALLLHGIVIKRFEKLGLSVADSDTVEMVAVFHEMRHQMV